MKILPEDAKDVLSEAVDKIPDDYLEAAYAYLDGLIRQRFKMSSKTKTPSDQELAERILKIVGDPKFVLSGVDRMLIAMLLLLIQLEQKHCSLALIREKLGKAYTHFSNPSQTLIDLEKNNGFVVSEKPEDGPKTYALTNAGIIEARNVILQNFE